MSVQSLTVNHLGIHSADDVFEVFRLLGYDTLDPQPFEGDDLDAFEFEELVRDAVKRAYIVARRDNHTVYLYEVSDVRQARLRSLAWDILRRGTGLLVVTRDYREVLFVDPRIAGKASKSNVRVNKLNLVSNDPTRHDADTLNSIHGYRRSGQQIYDAQAEAFNVTTITKKFYDEYRQHYEYARAVIKQHNKGVREFQNSDQTDKLHAFTQRLLGRLMFLYFLQRKGWLGGRQKFLTERYRDTARKHAHETTGDKDTYHYYREVLEPLFFETLNSKRPGDITRWEGIRIPYLNGGLFDASRDPDGPIILPDSLFDPNSSDGLLAFFNRYNFTIADDTPMEQDVAVDPEMLGKVFENMLEERDRGQSGSFYTPRTIVSYMCQESLAGYLEESAGIPRDTTRAQFDPDSELRFTPDEAERVNAALDTLTVLDPAVGSGSFPIGMMNEIIRVRRACYAVLNGTDDVPSTVLADWKEAIIRDTLYGVDIKPEAIEIAQLRLWLALVVDQTLEQARPLPNLDYKLMAGNSLIETIDGEPILSDSAQQMIGSDVTPAQQTLGFYESDKERFKLDELRQQFFRASPEERKRLRDDITAQERRIVETSLSEKADNLQAIINGLGRQAGQTGGRLKRSDENKLKAAAEKLAHITTLQEDLRKPDYVPPYFLYRLHFSEVFERKGGFDVVIANPPYVRGDDLGAQKSELEKAYPQVFSGRADLYIYFYARGVGLLRSEGQLAFITSNKWLRAKYGQAFRHWFPGAVAISDVVDFGELPVFAEAATFPLVLIASRGSGSNSSRFTQINEWNEGIRIGQLTELSGHVVEIRDFAQGSWQFSDASTRDLLTRLLSSGVALGEYVNDEVYMGTKTGRNSVFIIDQATRDLLASNDVRCSEVLRPVVVGNDIRKWKFINEQKYLIFTYRNIAIQQYPALVEYLRQFRSELEDRATSALHAWYELQQPQMGIFHLFEQPKIIFPDIAKEPRFTLDYDGRFTTDTAFIIPRNDLYLLGILNSSTVWHFLKETAAVLGDANRGGRLRLKAQYIKKVPVAVPPIEVRHSVVDVTRRCLDAARVSPETLPALEAELNALVYRAYGLDDDDIALIEGTLAKRSGAGGSVDEDDEAGEEAQE